MREMGRNVVFQDWTHSNERNILSTNTPEVTPWEVRAVASSGPTGEIVKSALLREPLLPLAFAGSVCGVKSSGTFEEGWLFPGVWSTTSSLETTVEKSTWFWSKAMFSVWGSVLFSDQWFLIGAETVRKCISENLLASERRSKLSEKPWWDISVKK